MTKKLFPDEQILTTKYFRVEQDRETPIPWFFILAYKGKKKSLGEFTKAEMEEFVHILHKTRKGMQKILNIKEVGIRQNEVSKRNFHMRIFPRYPRMKKVGERKITSVAKIMDYAKNHMDTNKVAKEVKKYVAKMKKYLKDK